MADERIDALFAAPPEEFVARRDELVRALKSEQRRDLVREVAALRRPTLAAWAVNRAVQTRPDDFAALREAGDALRRAMRRAVSGAGGADVRGATRARREQIAALTDHAVALLAATGADGSAHRDEIATTFDAASADPAAGDRVGAARLSRPEPAPSGFGDLSPLSVMEQAAAPSEPATEQAPAEPDAEAERRAELRAAVGRARRDAQEASAEAVRLEEEAQQAHGAAASARQEAERLRRAAEEAEQEADRRRVEADHRRDEAAAARRNADERVQALRKSEQQLEGAGG